MNQTLAQTHPWEHLGRQFREGGKALEAGDALLVLGVVVGVLLAAWLLSRMMNGGVRRPYRNSLWLFLELCRAHHLSWRESWLLWRLANAHDLTEPASIFLRPDCFVDDQTHARFARKRRLIEQLRVRLFGAA